ncbi:DUF2666 domain-containing protein [Thermococci archaeon]|nr:MAG: DUF2666 domain-containing protein [Thermococci archaeon]RLF95621.1 MAG: DUF2666 domain-containing protein [Thermococci archaeon]RLF99386.1 MAG: DUF2666 domain-containing protein [Thermococci archaeon]
MEDKINFFAKHEKWIVVKKMDIDENTEKIDIARLLISIRDTVNKKIFEYFDEEFDLQKIENIISDIVPDGKLSEEKIAEIFKKLKSPIVTKRLEGDKLKKEISKQILTEKVLQKIKLKTLDAETIDKYIRKKEMEKAFKS